RAPGHRPAPGGPAGPHRGPCPRLSHSAPRPGHRRRTLTATSGRSCCLGARFALALSCRFRLATVRNVSRSRRNRCAARGETFWPHGRLRVKQQPSSEPGANAMTTQHYDVIIIGTGAGGGTLAHKLAPSGKRILLLERGGYLPREPENWDSREVFIN